MPFAAPEVASAMLAAIVTSSDDAIISKDLNGVVRSWNQSAERMFGYTAAEMVGHSITILFPQDRLDEEPKILEQIRSGQRVDHFETKRIRKDGRVLDVSVTISPVRGGDGSVIGVSKVARDITSIKRTLQEREELLEREQLARAEAEHVSRMKDEFLATLSHELRTPLNAMLGWAQILRGRGRSCTPEDLEKGLETIERNARAQAQLIEELLDMSRILNGKLRLEVHSIDLQEIVADSIESIRPAAEAKNIRLNKVLDPRGGPIQGDPNRIQQVLWNLLSNAVKFTPRDGRIQVFLRRVDAHVEITITDSGQGIAADFVPQLFTRFTQADGSISRRHGGLGLGLALVKSLVELHGGSVSASSEGRDQGSTFVVSLPVAIAPVSSTPPVSAALSALSDQLSTPDLRGCRVLVVDDDDDTRTLIERILESSQASVTTASSAAEALDATKRTLPNVILSDIGMPDMDGYEFLSRVRRLSGAEGGDTPAVAVTAFARSEDRRRALMAGFHMHLPKPIEPSELLAVVESIYSANRRG